MTKAATVNRERVDEFAIDWRWAGTAPLEPGFTAVLRVKNEAATLPFVLPSLLRAVRRVLVVDNESDDGTPELALDLARRHDAADRLEVRTYPFAISRCGSEHLATPADSVHSLTYFYNWSFSHVQTTYALKWDGDMVLTESGVLALQDLAWQVERLQRVVAMPRYPLYVADERTAHLDVWVRNREFWAWPNQQGYEHCKSFEWELLSYPLDQPTLTLPDWTCFELKHLDVDEFAHWSPDDFSASGRTSRKQREMEVFAALAEGTSLPGLVEIKAPDGTHVIDYVRDTWIPQEKPHLRQLHKEVRAATPPRRS
jgi:glycosyltransferase involved in cell wall biosynthesis